MFSSSLKPLPCSCFASLMQRYYIFLSPPNILANIFVKNLKSPGKPSPESRTLFPGLGKTTTQIRGKVFPTSGKHLLIHGRCSCPSGKRYYNSIARARRPRGIISQNIDQDIPPSGNLQPNPGLKIPQNGTLFPLSHFPTSDICIFRFHEGRNFIIIYIIIYIIIIIILSCTIKVDFYP